MPKRAKCPKCKRDTWSEKWKVCRACGHSLAGNFSPDEVIHALARADAAGDKRQKKRVRLKKTIDRVPRFPVPFQTSAEELAEQAEGPVTTTNADPNSDYLYVKVMPPLPGEKCPTCNRKMPKRRKGND